MQTPDKVNTQTPAAEGAQQAPSITQDVQTATNKDAMNAIKLKINATFDEIAAKVPAVRAMVGFDQRSDFHSLTLDKHTRKVVDGLLANEYIATHPKRDLIVLAGYLHDIGKTSPEGQQVHKKDPEKRQYVDHEKESFKMTGPILENDFEPLPEEDKEFVLALVRLHASALNLMENFGRNNQPKGSELKAYEDFIGEVEKIPGEMDLLDKMKIIFAFNRADKLGGFNEESDKSDPKIAGIISKATKQVNALDELGKALPALIQAVMAKRAGTNDAGIVLENGEYQFRDLKKVAAETAMDGKAIGMIMKNAASLGVPKAQVGNFGKILREKGLDGLEAAGFGQFVGPIKELLSK